MAIKEWWKEAAVYQIYPRSFQDSDGDGIGDLSGIIRRLDYIKELGVDVIWLSPVYESPNVDSGYDISDYQAILAEFGTMDDFDRLLQQAHLHGLRVIMDLVVNHTSNRHAWFIESKSSRYSPKRDWYIWRDGYGGAEPNELKSLFSGSAWQYDTATRQYYMHLFTKEQPDLNWNNAAVHSAVYDIMDWWLKKGIDGFRIDVVNLLSKPASALAAGGGPDVDCFNGPDIHEYLREMNRKVLSRYDIMAVGETHNITVDDAKKYAGSDTKELNMVFQFDLLQTDHNEHGKWCTNRSRLKDIKTIMTKWQKALEGIAWNCLFWNNHDQPRAVSRFGDTTSVLFHEKSAKMLATCLYMMQGTPYIYQGEELGMTNAPLNALEDCRDVETFNAYRELVEQQRVYTHEEMMACIRRSGRDNCRTPMQWDGSANAGFSSGTPWIPVNPNFMSINAEDQRKNPDSVFHYYRRLLRLRKDCPAAIYGTYELLLPDDERIYAYSRTYASDVLIVLCNFTDQTITDIDISGMPMDCELLLGNYSADTTEMNLLRPYEARVLII